MKKEKENIIDNKELEENIAENDENLQEEIRAGVKKEQERFSWDKMAEAINGMLK